MGTTYPSVAIRLTSVFVLKKQFFFQFPAISILKGDTFSTFISLQLFSKLQCDDQPMLEHAEQLLGELGGEMEAEDEDPAVVDDFEPCSDDEDDDTAEDAMEH